ncbi:MAG: VOC family protein [Thaumarchaeota archaeon]|nr:VOC family protein [Nitrososphaerota archaeon]
MPRTKPTKSATRRSPAKKLAPIPPGFRTVTPYLGVVGAANALDFYKRAFGAKEEMRETTPDGSIIHARMKIGDSIVMVSDQFGAPPAPAPSPMSGPDVTLHIYSKDVDKLWGQAIAAGAQVAMPIDNMFWGERYGQVMDPFGHRWSMSMQVKMSKEEREAKRKAAMAMFAQDQHPSIPAGTA